MTTQPDNTWLDIELIKMANKVLDGKQETLGDYIDPTKTSILTELQRRVREAKIDELYGVGNNLIPYGRSDGSELGEYLENRISQLKEE